MGRTIRRLHRLYDVDMKLTKKEQLKIRTISNNKNEKNKFGIKIPGNAREALLLDKENKNTKWADVICKQIQNLLKLNIFEFHSPNTVFKKFDGWQYAPMHMIFTIKQEDLRHKARLVVNRNVVDASTFYKVC